MVKLFSKNSNLCDHNSPTSQTDRWTDRQTTCDRNTALCTKVHRAVIKLICYLGDSFTGQIQKNQPTVLKGWMVGVYQSTKKRYKTKENIEKANNTKYSKTIKTNIQKTASPLVYNSTMGWLGDGSHRGQGRQAWTAAATRVIMHSVSEHVCHGVVTINSL